MDSRLGKRQESINNLQRLITYILGPEKWGFVESYRHVDIKTLPYIIYDSKWCRVKFSEAPGDVWQESSTDVFYGRLHAPNEGAYITLEGQKYGAWHQVYRALQFLEGLTPKEAIRQRYTDDQWPRIIEPFHKRILKDGNRVELILEMHSTIWNYYGPQFFELFDLRQSDLWDKYRQFLKKYYDIKGRSPNIKPPLDQVC